MKVPAARLRMFCAGAIAALGLALVPAGASAGSNMVCTGTGTVLCTGTTTDRTGVSHYKIEVPSPWNGTLVLYSHGYSFTPSDAADVGDAATGAWLLSQGYALAGSSYSTAGWSVEQAIQDQLDVLNVFNSSQFHHPKRTIAWGHSLGGMITAGLIQRFPDRFTAALPMCGVLAGGPGVWNQGLDSEFAFRTLQPGAAFKLVNFTADDVRANFDAARIALAGAQATPQGRARIALSAALADIPGWFDAASPEPDATNYAAQEVNQFVWDYYVDFAFAFFGRLELETRAGGNFSWNTGVDYRVQLANSSDRAEVEALYAQPGLGLDLEQDLNTLNAAPRIAADPKAVHYLTKFVTFNGEIDQPVLTMHTTGDGLVEVTDEQAYADVVSSAGNSSLLRQVFVHRAYHCSFTPAETISAFLTLVHRVDTGVWSGTDPTAMNAQATALGPAFNIAPASFFDFTPTQFLRPFDARG